MNKKINISSILLISFTVLFLGLILVLPIMVIFFEAFSKGISTFFLALFTEYTFHAMLLSLFISIVSVMSATIFGIAAAWCMGHFDFRGRSILVSIIDLPISISPIIIGLSFVILYGKYGFLGTYLEPWGMNIIFSWPGLLLTNMCITTPFVLRSILPSIQAVSSEQEIVGKMLGAKGWQILTKITLPRIKWSLLYGIVLASARSAGEFGAASVVSGLIRKKTVTLPLLVEIYYNDYLTHAAFANAVLFIFFAMFTLLAKSMSERRNIKLNFV